MVAPIARPSQSHRQDFRWATSVTVTDLSHKELPSILERARDRAFGRGSYRQLHVFLSGERNASISSPFILLKAILLLWLNSIAQL